MKENADLPQTQTETAAQPTAPAQSLFRRILAPTDFSHESEIAVDYAVEIARPMHAQLTLLHVLLERSPSTAPCADFRMESGTKRKKRQRKS
jgi:hypothetical protein